jgi:hypothetical protein
VLAGECRCLSLLCHPDPTVNRGDRIAQLILEKIATPLVLEVDSLPDTVRGEGGFGSTGVAGAVGAGSGAAAPSSGPLKRKEPEEATEA